MEFLLSANARKRERVKKEVSRFDSGEWSMDFDVDRKVDENPKNAKGKNIALS